MADNIRSFHAPVYGLASRPAERPPQEGAGITYCPGPLSLSGPGLLRNVPTSFDSCFLWPRKTKTEDFWWAFALRSRDRRWRSPGRPTEYDSGPSEQRVPGRATARKNPLQGRGDQFSRHRGPHVPIAGGRYVVSDTQTWSAWMGLGRVALPDQTQGFGTEGGGVFSAFAGFWRVFHDEGKTPPRSARPN